MANNGEKREKYFDDGIIGGKCPVIENKKTR